MMCSATKKKMVGGSTAKNSSLSFSSSLRIAVRSSQLLAPRNRRPASPGPRASQAMLDGPGRVRPLLAFVLLHRRIDLLLHLIEVEGGRILHWWIVDRRQRQL